MMLLVYLMILFAFALSYCFQLFLVISDDFFCFALSYFFICLSSPSFTVGNEIVLYPFLLDLFS
jgi:hypothetical protein